MKRVPAIAVVIPIILVFGITLVIVFPALANHTVEHAVVDTLKRNYGFSENAYVEADSTLTSFMTGTITRVYVECPASRVNGIQAKNLIFYLEDLKFDMTALLLGKKPEIKQVGIANARVTFSEKEINRYVSENYPDMRGWRFTLEPGKVTATADIELIGRLNVDLKPRVKGNSLVIDPVGATFARSHFLGTGIGLGLTEAKNWIGEISVSIPVSDLPFGMKVHRILVEDDQLVVSAQN